jgi:hypothetical protein
MTMQRPDIGTTKAYERRVEICRTCGCVVDCGLCDYECDKDGKHVPDDGSTMYAVWQCKDTLIREEDQAGNVIRN